MLTLVNRMPHPVNFCKKIFSFNKICETNILRSIVRFARNGVCISLVYKVSRLV